VWRVVVVRYDAAVPAGVHGVLDELGDPSVAEERAGIPDGVPIVVAPDLSVDGRLSQFFLTFAPSSLATARTYASTFVTFFGFLERRGRSWDRAREADLEAYRFWRLADPVNPARITSASFNRELAALRRLYSWAQGRGLVESNPVRVRKVTAGEGRSPVDAPEAGVRGAKSSDVKWLTARAFERWRDVGLCGYLADGRRDPVWRGRNDGRNRAYVDGLWGTGLRSQEWASVLLTELPAVDRHEPRRYYAARVSAGVAKTRARSYWVPAGVLAEIGAYVRLERRHGIHRAWDEGTYERLRGIRIVEKSTAKRLTLWHRGRVEVVPLATLDARARRSVFRETKDGLEPLAVWLGETGEPMSHLSWAKAFDRANDRCDRLGLGELRCHPHMLRHSYALKMLLAAQRAYDLRLASHLSPEELRDFRLSFGSPFELVRHLLGHRDVQTTIDTYLEPVAGLTAEVFLNGDVDAEVSELLASVVAASDRVLDVPAGPK
jgi:site-specific recombinase XerD